MNCYCCDILIAQHYIPILSSTHDALLLLTQNLIYLFGSPCVSFSIWTDSLTELKPLELELIDVEVNNSTPISSLNLSIPYRWEVAFSNCTIIGVRKWRPSLPTLTKSWKPSPFPFYLPNRLYNSSSALSVAMNHPIVSLETATFTSAHHQV